MEKDNYICIFGKIIELLPEQLKKLKEVFDEPVKKLADVEPGETFKVGKHEFIVLEQHKEAGTAGVIYKGLLHENMKFGGSNNFDGSDVENACDEFADELAELIDEENIVGHEVDLLSDDGLDDYGKIRCRASLLTAEQYRRHAKILDKHKINKWWWLATSHSTETHENNEWVKCVSPRGCIYGVNYNYVLGGVRPFCIFKSSIFGFFEE